MDAYEPWYSIQADIVKEDKTYMPVPGSVKLVDLNVTSGRQRKNIVTSDSTFSLDPQNSKTPQTKRNSELDQLCFYGVPALAPATTSSLPDTAYVTAAKGITKASANHARDLPYSRTKQDYTNRGLSKPEYKKFLASVMRYLESGILKKYRYQPYAGVFNLGSESVLNEDMALHVSEAFNIPYVGCLYEKVMEGVLATAFISTDPKTYFYWGSFSPKSLQYYLNFALLNVPTKNLTLNMYEAYYIACLRHFLKPKVLNSNAPFSLTRQNINPKARSLLRLPYLTRNPNVNVQPGCKYLCTEDNTSSALTKRTLNSAVLKDKLDIRFDMAFLIDARSNSLDLNFNDVYP
jgi:hypothetical protein